MEKCPLCFFLGDKDSHGKKAARKTTRAGGGGADILKVAQEQSVKIQKEREELVAKIEAAKLEKEEAEAKEEVEEKAKVKVEIPEVDDVDEEAGGDVVQTEEVSEPTVSEPKLVKEEAAQVTEDTDQEKKKRVRLGPLVPDTVAGELSHITSLQLSVWLKLLIEVGFPTEQGVFFTSGLSDVTAIIGTDTELVCRLSKEVCDTVWYKDGNKVSS